MRVNVTVVIIPPISCSEHSRITTEALVKVVWDSNQSNATGSSLAQDAHSSTLITQDLDIYLKKLVIVFIMVFH